jgi:hypothetical protein
VVALACLVAVKFELSLTFRWSLFVWGLVVGICGTAWINWFISAATRLTDNQERLERIRHRRIIYSWMWPFLGAEIGVGAALFDVPWLIIAVAVYILALMVGSLLVLRHMKRRLVATGTSGISLLSASR